MSVFQDVTAVPFVIIIPVLGLAVSATELAASLGWTVEVVPETLEAAMMIAAHALLLLDVSLTRVVRRIQEQRGNRHQPLRKFIRGDSGFL